MLMSWRIFPTILGEGWRFPGFGPPPTPWSFNSAWNCQGISGCVISLVDWGLRSSLICHLVPFESNQFMLCPWAQHSFKSCGGGGRLVPKLCPTLATPWTVAHQAPLSMGFPRQEYWSELPFPSPGDLPNIGVEPKVDSCHCTTRASQLPYSRVVLPFPQDWMSHRF